MDTYNDNLHKNANPKLYEFSRLLRRETTEAEKRLWQYLRGGKLHGLKFRRQHPLLTYIVDFYCHERKLAIEVDGLVHSTIDSAEHDKARTFQLKELDIVLLRFWNDEVLNSIETVLASINEAALNAQRKMHR